MAAPTEAYQETSASLHIDAPPWTVKKTVANGEAMTINWLNVTQWIEVYANEEVKVSWHAGGVVATAYRTVPAGAPFSVPCQCVTLIVGNDSGSSASVEVTAVLSRVKAADFPALTEANGFDGVQSHHSVTVA
ncbi:MAG: hypothetical protein ABIL09_11145 [Gemmatimonadota bacterium]